MTRNIVSGLLPLLALAVAGTLGRIPPALAGVPLSIVDRAPGLHTLAPLLERVSPAVVGITVRSSDPRDGKATTKYRSVMSRLPSAQDRTASGIILNAAHGLIVTNKHVLDHGSGLAVELSDGRKLEGELMGADVATDIAVIKTRAEGLTAATLGDSDELERGDLVFTVGNAAPLGRTVTAGTVGGLHRSLVGLSQAEDFIQTDAAFYPGHSGSALVDIFGQVIGINAGFMAPSRTHSGMGFAIPANLVRNIVDEILEWGEVRRGSLGFTLARPTAVELRNRSPTAPITPVVDSIEAGSAAERAGLKVGDVITAIGGIAVRDADESRSRLGLERAGNPVELKVRRADELIAIRAVMPEPIRAQSGSQAVATAATRFRAP